MFCVFKKNVDSCGIQWDLGCTCVQSNNLQCSSLIIIFWFWLVVLFYLFVWGGPSICEEAQGQCIQVDSCLLSCQLPLSTEASLTTPPPPLLRHSLILFLSMTWDLLPSQPRLVSTSFRHRVRVDYRCEPPGLFVDTGSNAVVMLTWNSVCNPGWSLSPGDLSVWASHVPGLWSEPLCLIVFSIVKREVAVSNCDLFLRFGQCLFLVFEHWDGSFLCCTAVSFFFLWQFLTKHSLFDTSVVVSAIFCLLCALTYRYDCFYFTLLIENLGCLLGALELPV